MTEKALTPLQQAYLLGRSQVLPLGGVAMQEFREYRGRLDLTVLRARLIELVGRHDCLRTHIDPLALVQRVSPEPVLNFEEVDLRRSPRADALAQVEASREEYAHRHCDLSRAPWQVTAFRLPEPEETNGDTGVVFLRFDALCVDGRSIALLARELFGGEATTEPAVVAPAGEPEPPSARSEDAAYWTQKLQSVTGPSRLPWRRPLETIKVSRYARESLVVASDRYKKLTRVGASQHLFANSTLTALVLEVLSRWLAEGALAVGIPVAPQGDGPLGNRSSFLALGWNPQAGTFVERAKSLQTDVLQGLEHLSFSGVDITRLLMNAQPGVPPLPVVITNGLSWPSLTKDAPVRLHGGLTQTPQVAMDVRLSLDAERNLVVDIDHAREAIESAQIRDILAALDRAITAICTAGALSLTARDLVDYDHYRLNERSSAPSGCGFLAQVAEHLFGGRTTGTALIAGTTRVGYPELGERVGRVMAALRARDVGHGSVVAVCLPRSIDHTTVTLACALVGAVWVPVDAGAPAARVRYLLDNCQPQLVVACEPVEGFPSTTPDTLLSASAPSQPRALAPELEARSASEQPAYYLYTSGTTGKPKCVVVSNRGTANVIARTIEHWQIAARDVFLSVTPLHHDMSVFDVFGCLTAGATLVLPSPGEERDAVRWNQLVREHGVTVWCSVPAILEMLLSCRRDEELRSLRLVAQGGDYIKPAVIAELRRLLPSARLLSLGGPTETTIWSIWHEIAAEDIDLIPYGRPLPGNAYYVLNERGEHCPVGVVGRIHTAGVNVALGYLESGLLAQHDFVTIEDEQGERVRAFRTGDCGRYRRDGTLLFAGRVAGYVKVRGVRVSLADVESELGKHPALQRVLVVDYGAERQGESAIGALYVAEPGTSLSPGDLRAFARRQLPESHVPSRYLAVDELPLSANGKPDRKRGRELLTAASASDGPSRTPAAASADALTHELLDIYLRVLDKRRVAGVDETTDFMSLGLLPSHLKAVSTRIREQLGVALAPPQLLRCRNVRQLAQLPAFRELAARTPASAERGR